MSKIIKSGEIRNYIKSGSTIMVTGITLGGFAEEAAVEIEKCFLETGAPRDLAFYFMTGIGNRKDTGLAHIAHEGLLKRAVGGHLLGCGPAMVSLCRENKAEIYNFPQGVMASMCRYVAAKKPGVITRIGLKTMMDPRFGGGKMNKLTASCEDLVELISIHGEEWLLYKLPEIDVTLIRGTVADVKGNISVYKEGYQLGQLAAAEAARACGGIVIAQVQNIVEAGTLKPKDVKVPGILVDYIFTSKPEYHWQTAQTVYNPVFSGEIRIPLDSIPLEKLSARKVIARRASMELTPGDIMNLGVGIPEAISSVAAEEGCESLFTMTTEAGGVGGIPASAHDFGCCWNAEATLEMADQFDMYDGGALDFGSLGCLQVAPDGSVNASMRDGGGIGVGGFMNVAGGAKKIVFTFTFTGGKNQGEGPKFEIKDGKLKILAEGNEKKFVNKIEQVTFSGEVAAADGRDILFVTERAVFELSGKGLVLTEIAPGVDLEKDLLANMEFKPIVSDKLKLMDAAMFDEKWGKLAQLMAAKSRS